MNVLVIRGVSVVKQHNLMQNVSQNNHTHLGPSMTRCRSYNIKTKEATSTRLKV